MVLSAREKLLLALLGAIAALGLVWFAVGGLQAYEAGLARQVRAREATLEELGRLSATLERLERTAPRAAATRPLLGRLELLAQRSNVAERLQLNLLSQDRNSELESAEVRVDGMTLDELVGFVHAIESAVPPLVIDHVELSPAFRDKTRLRATMRVLSPR